MTDPRRALDPDLVWEDRINVIQANHNAEIAKLQSKLLATEDKILTDFLDWIEFGNHRYALVRWASHQHHGTDYHSVPADEIISHYRAEQTGGPANE